MSLLAGRLYVKIFEAATRSTYGSKLEQLLEVGGYVLGVGAARPRRGQVVHVTEHLYEEFLTASGARTTTA